MQHSLWIVFAILLLLPALIVGQTAPAHPAPTPHLGHQPGLLDSIKQWPTSRGIDSGQQVEQVRNTLVASTIKSYEFWIAAVSVSLSVGLFFYVVYLDAVRRQVVRSTARLVAKYQSQLATGQRNFLLLQEKYSKFTADFEQQKEPRISTKAPTPKGRNTDDNRAIAADLRTATVTAVSPQPQASPAAAPTDETVISMRRQITTLTHQLEEERQKNRKLRGE